MPIYRGERRFVVRMELSAEFGEDYEGDDDDHAWLRRLWRENVRPRLVRGRLRGAAGGRCVRDRPRFEEARTRTTRSRSPCASSARFDEQLDELASMRAVTPPAAWLVALGVLAVAWVWPRTAAADVPFVDRPVTLPPLHVSADVGVGFGPVDYDIEVDPTNPQGTLDQGTKVGFGSNLEAHLDPYFGEVGVRVGYRFNSIGAFAQADHFARLFDPVVNEPGTDATTNPELSLRGTLFALPLVEIALETRAILPTAAGSDFALTLGAPVRIRRAHLRADRHRALRSPCFRLACVLRDRSARAALLPGGGRVLGPAYGSSLRPERRGPESPSRGRRGRGSHRSAASWTSRRKSSRRR